MQTLQKIEDTWYDAPWYCDTEYDSTQRVLDGRWHGWKLREEVEGLVFEK